MTYAGCHFSHLHCGQARKEVGDMLQVLPGARIPADGDVVAGATHIDESMLTGESLPVPKEPGHPVIGGTMNAGGMIQVSFSPCEPY